jgi:molecular chaperone GrpE (heat shock protein)
MEPARSMNTQDNTRNEPQPHADGVRQRIMNRFEVWLDEILANPPESQGITNDILDRLQGDESESGSPESNDLYSLFAVLTSLVQETRSQAETLTQLGNAIAPIDTRTELMEKQVQTLEQTLLQEQKSGLDRLQGKMVEILSQQQTDLQQATQQTEIKEAIDCLIAVKDSLTAKQPPREPQKTTKAEPSGGLLTRLVQRSQESKQTRQNVSPANHQFTVERIDKALARWDIRPIDALGKFFSPKTMRAAELVDASDQKDGMVIEVIKCGYWQDKQVYRPAEVKVIRNQAELENAFKTQARSDSTGEVKK